MYNFVASVTFSGTYLDLPVGVLKGAYPDGVAFEVHPPGVDIIIADYPDQDSRARPVNLCIRQLQSPWVAREDLVDLLHGALPNYSTNSSEFTFIVKQMTCYLLWTQKDIRIKLQRELLQRRIFALWSWQDPRVLRPQILRQYPGRLFKQSVGQVVDCRGKSIHTCGLLAKAWSPFENIYSQTMQHSSKQGGRIGGNKVSEELSVPLKSISAYAGSPPGHSRYSTANIAGGEALSSVP